MIQIMPKESNANAHLNVPEMPMSSASSESSIVEYFRRNLFILNGLLNKNINFMRNWRID